MSNLICIQDALKSRPCKSPISARVNPRRLTRAQAEVVELLRDMSNREIALELGISEHTVARHLRNAYVRLRVCRRTAAYAVWMEMRRDEAQKVRVAA